MSEQDQKKKRNKLKDYNTIPLGTKGRPLPMTVLGEKFTSGSTKIPNLGVLETNENPLMMLSKRKYPEVLGTWLRGMPIPSMLHLLFDAVKRRQPDAHGQSRAQSRVQMYEGVAGLGKSHLASLIGEMRHPEGALKVDCGGKSVEELMFETVLDPSSSQPPIEKIDNRISEHNAKLSPLDAKTLTLLEKTIGDEYIHWDEDNEVNDKAFSIDWDKLLNDKEPKEAIEILNNAQHALSLKNEEASGFKIITRYGPLIQAWLQDREIILDEWDKRKEGTEGKLQMFWQIVNGEIRDKHTVTGNGGIQFTFDPADMGPGFGVTITANKMTDGAASTELSLSLATRLKPETIGDAFEYDWEHRMCQLLTGLPVSTLYEANKQHWDENPQEFTKFLMTARTIGLSEQQKAQIPEYEFAMIKQWQDVLEATEHLAAFYYEAQQMTDPESDLYANDPDGRFADMAEELDGAEKDLAISFRTMIDHVTRAARQIPDVESPANSEGWDLDSDFSEAPQVSIDTSEPLERSFGTRMKAIIIDDIKRKTVGRPNMERHLRMLAENKRILEPNLQEGLAHGDRLVADLLDYDPSASVKLSEQAFEVQKQLADYLRNLHPDQNLSEEDGDLIPAQEVQTMLDRFMAMKDEDFGNSNSHVFIVPNPDAETAVEEPLLAVVSDDRVPTQEDVAAHFEEHGEDAESMLNDVEIDEYEDYDDDISKDDLLDAETFLTSLAVAPFAKKNLTQIWTDSLSKVDPDVSSENDISLGVAVNESKSKLGMTTISVYNSQADKISHMHVLRNGDKNQTLIVGDDVSDATRALLKDKKIDYVSRSEDNAMETVKEKVKELTEGKDANDISALRLAFYKRNHPPSSKDIEELLVDDKEHRTLIAHYVTKTRANLGGGSGAKEPQKQKAAEAKPNTP